MQQQQQLHRLAKGELNFEDMYEDLNSIAKNQKIKIIFQSNDELANQQQDGYHED